MAKGDFSKRPRILFEWRLDFDGDHTIVERYSLQIPPVPAAFVMNLTYRSRFLKSRYPTATVVSVRNPTGPSVWVHFQSFRKKYGMAKELYKMLITDCTPKCPHCGGKL